MTAPTQGTRPSRSGPDRQTIAVRTGPTPNEEDLPPMAGTIDKRLEELGIELPQAAAPAANYVPYVVSGKLVFVAGQVTEWNG